MSEPSQYEQLKAMGVSDVVIAAFDILTDDGMSAEAAWTRALAAERAGVDPEAHARHIVELRKALRP